MNHIKNPVLKGFNPDPSILRVGDDYYIATSTFEWFPGVQIHHSRDLINWQLVTRPLNRVSQIDLRGNPNSGGVWAPCFSYSNGIYYLIYTDVKSLQWPWFDTHNYLVTSNNICGEWSEPVYLNSSGFDPSLFHDDGRKWLVNMCWDYRNEDKFYGVDIQEYDTINEKLIGPVKNIFKGTKLSYTEGPHLYKKDGYYFLLTAEGGTGYKHAVTIARSKEITGPYEVHPSNPILTSEHNEELTLQKSGHGSFVETQNGEWYLAHLCARPLTQRGRCVLGRETAIQKVVWQEDGWPYMEHGDNTPCVNVPAPELPEHKFEAEASRDNFESDILNIHFQTLRMPLGEDTLSLVERPGYLRLKGRESLGSKFCQSLVARRQQAFSYIASTSIEYEPKSFKHSAGLICYYSTENFYYLRISHDEKLKKFIGVDYCDNKQYKMLQDSYVSVPYDKSIYLKADVDYEKLQFYYSLDGKQWIIIGPMLDMSILSDEYPDWGFTGAFVGLCCQDLSGSRLYADFNYFEYVERN